MFISRSMTPKVVTVGEQTNIAEARDKMDKHQIRHLPVVKEDNFLVGIVTDRDIRSALPSAHLPGFDGEALRKRAQVVKVKDIMTQNPVTISPSDTIQDALLLIQKLRVGALPVVDEQGRLKGILSVRDLLRAFINVLGLGEPGTLLGILVEHKIGQMKKIVDAITEEKISFGSILVARYWDEGKRAVFPYLLTQNVGPVKRKLEKMGYTLLDPMEWHLDHPPKDE
ncbi:MAG: CBS domain-containing protein [Proteobacteria bacterium]|nr:CBS domain-containing protein [Pseudomonadota bacterium]